jgi:nucleoporin POM152
MCKAAVTDLRYNVHALPSAQVGHGKKIFQDIHEGDQAEIVFTLVGEPPFSMTYQRAELPTRKGMTPKVLETHTVSRIQGHEYSIFTALEGMWKRMNLHLLTDWFSNLGTWTVTSISDRYCRYPPVQPDVALDKY